MAPPVRRFSREPNSSSLPDGVPNYTIQQVIDLGKSNFEENPLFSENIADGQHLPAKSFITTMNKIGFIRANKGLYLNKEKVQNLITQQRRNLADVSYLDLNSINNIINNFKNPSTGNKKIKLFQQILP